MELLTLKVVRSGETIKTDDIRHTTYNNTATVFSLCIFWSLVVSRLL